MQKKIFFSLSLITFLLITILVMSGCTAIAAVPVQGELTTLAVAAPDTGDLLTHVAAAVQPESCSTCHPDAGDKHQASYDELYQDGVIQITDLAYSFTEPGTSTVTFQMTKDGAPFDGRKVESLNIYFAPYTGSAFQFEPAAARMSIKGELTYDGAGNITSTLDESTDLSKVDGLIVMVEMNLWVRYRRVFNRPNIPLRPYWKPDRGWIMSLLPITLAV